MAESTHIMDDITEQPSQFSVYAEKGVQFAKDNPTVFFGVIVLVCVFLVFLYWIIIGSKDKKSKTAPAISDYDAIIDEIHEMQK